MVFIHNLESMQQYWNQFKLFEYIFWQKEISEKKIVTQTCSCFCSAWCTLCISTTGKGATCGWSAVAYLFIMQNKKSDKILKQTKINIAHHGSLCRLWSASFHLCVGSILTCIVAILPLMIFSMCLSPNTNSSEPISLVAINHHD